MSCLGCERIESHPVKLHDGRVACSSCEAWRAECEARTIMRMATVQERRAWLDGIESKRGKKARESLQALITTLWPSR